MLSVPTEVEKEIMEQVGIKKPEGEYAVEYRGKDTIRLLHYHTRDTITIRRGDRPWPKERKYHHDARKIERNPGQTQTVAE